MVDEGIILLGAPLGSEAFVKEAIKSKVSKVEEISALLPLLEDPHTEFVLLRSCLALPKIAFILCPVDTASHIDQLQALHDNTRECLTRILGCPLDERAWRQAKLPVGMGGLGLRGAKSHAPGVSQKQISYKVDLYQQQVWQQEFEEDEVRERARVASVSLPHAGDWLVVAPLVALGLHLRPQEFVLAVKYRLGLALFD